MKINKLFCIDLDLCEKLSRIDNQAKLVNDLLRDYFQYNEGSSIIDDAKKSKIKQLRAIIKQEKRDLRIINTVFSSEFDQFCINWCYNKGFKYSNDDISTYLRSRKKKLTIDQFLKYADIIQKNGALFKKTG